MIMALASSPGEAWAEEDFWDGHKLGDPLDERKTPAMCLA